MRSLAVSHRQLQWPFQPISHLNPASLPGVATQQRMDSFFRILPFTNNNKKQLTGAKRKGRRAGGQARKKPGPRSRRMKHLELSII